MAFRIARPIAGKPVFPAFFPQGIFPDYFDYYVKDCVHIVTALLQQLEVFFELIGKSKIQHGLKIQVLARFLNGTIPLGRGFSVNHILNFLHCGDCYGVRDMLLAAFRANTAVIIALYANSGLFCFRHNRLLCLNFTAFRGKKASYSISIGFVIKKKFACYRIAVLAHNGQLLIAEILTSARE